MRQVRTWLRGVLAVLLLLLLLLPSSDAQASTTWCQQARITGYVRTEHSNATFDGTSIYTDEPIAAASWNIPIDSQVDVEGVGVFRVADRGLLGNSGWVDIAVWTRAEAFELTSVREVCVTPP